MGNWIVVKGFTDHATPLAVSPPWDRCSCRGWHFLIQLQQALRASEATLSLRELALSSLEVFKICKNTAKSRFLTVLNKVTGNLNLNDAKKKKLECFYYDSEFHENCMWHYFPHIFKSWKKSHVTIRFSHENSTNTKK